MTLTKEGRERNKKILLALLNYLLEYHSNDMVFDDFSQSKQWYLGDLKRTEEDIKKYRSKQIKKRLDIHISLLRHRYDLNFNDYIKENTGYDIDIFEEYKTRILPILAKKEIDNNDSYLVENYLKAYRLNPKEKENVAILEGLLVAHKIMIDKMMSLGKTETFYSIVQGKKSITMNEEEYTVYNKKFNDKWLLSEEISPNGLFKLNVQFNGKGACASTYVVISLIAGTGIVYGVVGEKLPIKAYWGDNNSVIIETKKEYKTSCKYSQVSSYGEVFKIEYRFY